VSPTFDSLRVQNSRLHNDLQVDKVFDCEYDIEPFRNPAEGETVSEHCVFLGVQEP
jgi:hypothetical protein